ncbi:oligosaccharide biosynthesis protein Alg14 like-domain-containing protein [Gautieria morchelliformis]|nr:oligosaccharide biosynthesis protein Alg14 like-domain-containing protein [Gautieria morchelliformis]
MRTFVWFITLVFFAIVCRVYALMPSSKQRRTRSTRRHRATCHLAVFLGSGGHTSEAFLLLSAIDFARYTPRSYVVSQGDTLSVQRALAFESSKYTSTPPEASGEAFTIIHIPRARRVHQSLIMTLPTAINSLASCIYHICLRPMITRKCFADVLLVNGPGTCVMLCAAAYISRVFFIPSPRLIYVESFARVSSLSLSGRLLRPFVDRFVVQWPEALKDGRHGDCPGWLV